MSSTGEYQMNAEYLQKLCQLLSKKEVRITNKTYCITTLDSFANGLYQRLLFLQNKKKCHKIEPYSEGKFRYNYDIKMQQHSFSLCLNGIPYVTMERTSKISSQIREQILFHFKQMTHRANKENAYLKLIAYLIYDVFFVNQINFPSQEEKKIITLEELYNILSQPPYGDSILTWNDTWDSIYHNKEKLCYYLFGIHQKEKPSDINKILSEWKGLSYPSINDSSELYTIAKEIVDATSIQPMYEYLMKEEPIKHREDVREILKHMVKCEKCRNIRLDPPVKSITNWILKLVHHMASTKLYTAEDFLRLIGLLAHKAKDMPNYSLTEQDINEIRKQEYQQVSDNMWNTIYVAILKDFKASFLASHHLTNGYKFKIKPFRLILAGMYDARYINEKKENPIPFIENYFPIETEQEKVRLQADFNKKNDSYCFYGLSLLYHLDSNIRTPCFTELCEKASDFSVPYREKQICYIYLLTTILASEIPLTFEQRERFFQHCYGKTMYRFQALFVKYLRRSSAYYEICVEDAIQKACTIETIHTNQTIVNKAKGQPYYFFVYGILHEDYDIKQNKPFQAPDSFLKFAACIQCKTWYPTSKVDNKDLIVAIRYGFNEALERILANQNTRKLSSALMKYTYGIQLLGYAIANLVTYHKIELQHIFHSKSEKETALKALLYSDYYMRKANPLYPEHIADGCLLCGSYRAICAIDFGLKITLFTNEGNEGSVIPSYREWLKAEWENNSTKRYAYLMTKLLQNVAFGDIKIKLINEILDSDISTIDFLDYDNVHHFTNFEYD